MFFATINSLCGQGSNPLSIATVRLTGNEPTLQWDHVLDFLKILDDRSKISKLCQHVFEVSHPLHQKFSDLLHDLKILIQTNGVEIGRKDSPICVEDLERIRDLDVTFEVSFKRCESASICLACRSTIGFV